MTDPPAVPLGRHVVMNPVMPSWEAVLLAMTSWTFTLDHLKRERQDYPPPWNQPRHGCVDARGVDKTTCSIHANTIPFSLLLRILVPGADSYNHNCAFYFIASYYFIISSVTSSCAPFPHSGLFGLPAIPRHLPRPEWIINGRLQFREEPWLLLRTFIYPRLPPGSLVLSTRISLNSKLPNSATTTIILLRLSIWLLLL